METLCQHTKLRIKKDGSSQVAHDYLMNLLAAPQIMNKLLLLTVSICKHKRAKFGQFLKEASQNSFRLDL